MAANAEFTESLSALEFDAESESFHATYDSTRDATSLAVVAVVATALGKEPQTLTALQSVIETDALDRLAAVSPSGAGSCETISFTYGGFEITVTAADVIEAEPIESA